MGCKRSQVQVLSPRFMVFCVYILQSLKDGGLYIGHTQDLPRRLNEHNDQYKKTYTARRGPWRLLHCEEYRTRSEAVQRERFLKSHAGEISGDIGGYLDIIHISKRRPGKVGGTCIMRNQPGRTESQSIETTHPPKKRGLCSIRSRREHASHGIASGWLRDRRQTQPFADQTSGSASIARRCLRPGRCSWTGT